MRFYKYLNEKIILRDEKDKIIDEYELNFTKKNIEKIAYKYDTKIYKLELNLKSDMLKDKLNRIIFIDAR